MTGVLSLPVECLKKRSDVTIVGGINELNFGKVVIGEAASQVVTFRNHGALPAKMSVEGDALGLFSIEHSVDDGLLTGGGDKNGTANKGRGVGAGLVTAGSMGFGGLGGDADGNGAEDDYDSGAEGGGAAADGIGADGAHQQRLSAVALVTHTSLSGAPQQQQQFARPGTAATEASVATEVIATMRATTAARGQTAAGGGGAAAVAVGGSVVKPFTSVPDFTGAISAGRSPQIIIPPFSEQSLTITFAPREACHFETSFFFSFESATVEDKVVFVKGEATALPIFISENRRINFQCAFFNTMYRDSFTVANTGNSAARVTPVVPPLLRDSLEFVPKFGFIQAGATLTFQVKFAPEASPAFAAAYVTGRDGSVAFEQAVKVTVSGQTLPLFLAIAARLSRNSLRISHPPTGELCLGNVYTSEAIEARVVVTNSANIARKVGFVGLPPNVELRHPHTAVFSILPGEALPITLAIRVPGGSVGQFTQVLRLMSEHNDGCSLTITGQGRSAPVELYPALVAFPPTAVGAATEGHATLTSTSAVPQDFTFLTLARHGVSVEPSRGTILPGEQIPITLTFAAEDKVINLALPPPVREEDFFPPASDAADALGIASQQSPTAAGSGKSASSGIPKAPPSASSTAPSAGGAKKKGKHGDEEAEKAERAREEAAQRREALEKLQRERDAEVIAIRRLIPWEASAPGEAWALHRELVIPCAIRPTPTASALADTEAAASAVLSNASVSNNGSTSSSAAPQRVAKPLFITARCCVVRPVATIEPVRGPNAKKLAAAAPDDAPAVPLLAPPQSAAGLKGTGSAKGGPNAAGRVGGKGGASTPAQQGLLLAAAAAAAADSNAASDAQQRARAGSLSVVGEGSGEFASVGVGGNGGNGEKASPTTTLDFGNVPSLRTVTKSLIIRHTRPDDPRTAMLLHCHPLDPFGVFTIARPPQRLLRGGSDSAADGSDGSAGASTEVIVRFQPRADAIYEQTLRIMCEVVAIESGGEGNHNSTAQNNDSLLLSPDGRWGGGPNASVLTTSTAAPSGGGGPLVLGKTISRHCIVAHLTGRGQPAALTITRSQQRSIAAAPTTAPAAGGPAPPIAPAAGGKGAPNNAAAASGQQQQQGNNANNSSSPTTAGGGGGDLSAFGDVATAHEQLDQLTNGLRGESATLVNDMGTCVAGDILERRYDFTNCSEFPLVVSTEIAGPPLNRNPNHLCPFAATPCVLTIPPRQRVAVAFTFSPTVEGTFAAEANVRFGGDGACHVIRLSGRATEKGLYVIPPHSKTANAVGTSNPVASLAGGASLAGTFQPPADPFASAGGAAEAPPPLPSATAGFASRRDGLSALLSLLPAAACPAPGGDALHPMTLTFATTAVRTFGADGDGADGADGSGGATAGKSAAQIEKERKAEERRLKKEAKEAAAAAAAAAAAGTASGNNTARSGGRTPRQLAQASARREDDGPALSCTIVSTTATHQLIIGNNRSSAAGEYVIEGLTESDASYGWSVSVAGVAPDDGAALVSGANTGGGGGLVAPPTPAAMPLQGTVGGGASPAGAGAVGGAAAGAKGAAVPPIGAALGGLAGGPAAPGAVPPIRGTLLPGQTALVHIAFAPRLALIESLPLDGVDIVALADLRVSTRGGMPATGPEGRTLHLQLKGIVRNT